MTSGFLDELIERIGRVRPEEVQSYLLRLADKEGFLETKLPPKTLPNCSPCTRGR